MRQNLLEMPNSPYYSKEGVTPWHPYSFFGTYYAGGQIIAIAETFQRLTGKRPGLNDMSLPWGGRFDLGPPYGSEWHAPHDEHMLGLNADFPFRYIDPERETFRRIATALGGRPFVHPDHYHLHFPF